LTKENVTVPAGGEGVPSVSVSLTVAVQLLVVPIWFTSGLQLTDVDVFLFATRTFVLPELVSWSALPL
jgi:hypothetical protein